MLWRRGLLMRYLDAVGHVLDRLAKERSPRIAPFTSLALLVLFVSPAAFSSPIPLRACSFLPFALALVLAVASRELGNFLKLVGLILPFLTIIALPLPFITPGAVTYAIQLGPLRLVATREGTLKAAAFVLRCLNAISIGVAWTAYAGLTTLIRGLHAVDPTGTIPNMAFLTARYVPLSIREAQRLLAAREARLLRKPRISSSWLVLASCCGDLLLRAFNRAWKVGLAMRARCPFGSPANISDPRGCFRLGVRDLIWLLAAVGYIALFILEVV